MQPVLPESLPIKSIKWASHIPSIGAANRALASYDGTLYRLPSPDVLLSPLTTQEAVLSSRIEGTQADLEDVLKYDAGEKTAKESTRHDIQEIVNYRKALHRSERSLKERPFCLNTLLELHKILLAGVRGFDKGRGRFRTVQNWIGTIGTPIEKAEFVPPDPGFMMDHLGNWEKYYHADEPDPLVQLAVVHAQFEIIHPFVDGNGRIGRMLIPLFLYEKKLLHGPNFYMSAYLEARRDEYIRRLRELGQPGSWDRWIKFFLAGISQQAEKNSTTARNIQDLYGDMKARTLSLTHSQYAVPLVDYVFKKPIFRSSDVARHKGMPSTPMVMSMLTKLKAAGILKVLSKGAGRRPQVLALAELINLCEGKKVI